MYNKERKTCDDIGRIGPSKNMLGQGIGHHLLLTLHAVFLAPTVWLLFGHRSFFLDLPLYYF